MIDIAAECRQILGEAKIATVGVEGSGRALMFEGMTILGFVLTYRDAAELKERWRVDAEILVLESQTGLRRAQAKAWNTYIVLLAGGAPSYADQVALATIEGDLTGTRKLATAGIVDAESLRVALLPLLPIQSAPRLEAVDMKAEIQLRTTELPPRAVEAFLSGASEAVVAQMLEDLP